MPPDVPSAPRVRDGVRAALPLAPAPFLFGLSFGVLADAAGMDRAAATVMSATTFAGSAQFAVATILDDGGTVLAAILAAAFPNARYIAIGVSVASIVPGSRLTPVFPGAAHRGRVVSALRSQRPSSGPSSRAPGCSCTCSG